MSARTPFTETEALLIALDHGESDELHEYIVGHFTVHEARALRRAAKALAWTLADAEPEMRRAEGVWP